MFTASGGVRRRPLTEQARPVPGSGQCKCSEEAAVAHRAGGPPPLPVAPSTGSVHRVGAEPGFSVRCLQAALLAVEDGDSTDHGALVLRGDKLDRVLELVELAIRRKLGGLPDEDHRLLGSEDDRCTAVGPLEGGGERENVDLLEPQGDCWVIRRLLSASPSTSFCSIVTVMLSVSALILKPTMRSLTLLVGLSGLMSIRCLMPPLKSRASVLPSYSSLASTATMEQGISAPIGGSRGIRTAPSVSGRTRSALPLPGQKPGRTPGRSLDKSHPGRRRVPHPRLRVSSELLGLVLQADPR